MKEKMIIGDKSAGRRAAKFKKVLLTSAALALTVLALPALCRAEEALPKGNDNNIRKEVTVQFFAQKGYNRKWEAGFGMDAKIGIDPVEIHAGTSVAGEINTGAMSLERVSLDLTFPLALDILSGTIYGQTNRFLGDQKAVGASLGGNVGPVYLFLGAEYDIAASLVPIYAGVEAPIGPVTLTATPSAFVDSKGGDPLLGGEIKLGLKTRIVNLFARAFGITDKKFKEPIVGNVQAGIEFPL